MQLTLLSLSRTGSTLTLVSPFLSWALGLQPILAVAGKWQVGRQLGPTCGMDGVDGSYLEVPHAANTDLGACITMASEGSSEHDTRFIQVLNKSLHPVWWWQMYYTLRSDYSVGWFRPLK